MSIRSRGAVFLFTALLGLTGSMSAQAAGDSEGQPHVNWANCATEGGEWDWGGLGGITSCCFSDGCYICDETGEDCEFDAPYGGPYAERPFDFGVIVGTRPHGSVGTYQGTVGTFQTLIPAR